MSYSSYQDYANKSEDEMRGLFGAPFSASTFPAKLHYMLSEVEKDGQDQIISWNHRGRSFRVHDRELLQTNLLPL